jgi:predicted nucleotidyltransferase
MAFDIETVIKYAKQYIEDVKKVIPIDKVYLYGSYAKNLQRADSDVDLCFFSTDFEDKPRWDVLTQLFLLKHKYNRKILIEPNAFPTSEIGNDNPFVNEVIQTGIEL